MWRCNRAMISNYSTVHPLMGLRKDHKKNIDDNEILGPKLRPLCPANVAPNTAFGNLIAKIARATADEFQYKHQTEVISTEELKFHIEQLNIKIQERIMNSLPARSRPNRKDTVPPIQDMRSTIVLSLDVVALYPSISKDLATRTMVKAIIE